MDEILAILSKVKPGQDYAHDEDLIGHKILDSLNIITLVFELEQAFGISITPVDVTPENFKSAAAIQALVERKENE